MPISHGNTTTFSHDGEEERTRVWRPAAAPRPAPIQHALLLRQEAGPPRSIVLGESAVRIGRSGGNDLVLSSPEISRQHCEVSIRGEDAVVTDLGSTNGVYLDGQRVGAPTTLRPGVLVAIGPFTLHYQRGSPDELLAAEAREREEAQAVAYIQALLPRPLAEGPVRVDWRFHPSAQLGGDAFGYRWLDDDRFAVFLLDVSGHGTGSALLAASAANTLRAGSLPRADDPAAVLAAVNAAFQMEEHNGLFFTLWYGVYHRRGRMLRYASAGHHPAYLVHHGREAPLATRAPAIGMAPAPRYVAAEVTAPPGVQLYLFSDGAFEVTLPDGRQGAIADLLALVRDGVDPGEVIERVRERVDRRPFEDDVSLLRIAFP